VTAEPVRCLSGADLQLSGPAAELLALPVSPTLYDEAEWRRKQAEGSAFVTRIGVQPKIWIVLSPTDGASHGHGKD
jgi:hypothetical protein